MRAGTAGDRARLALTLALSVALIGAVVTVGMAALLAASQARGARQQMDRRSELVAAAATTETARYTDTVQSVAVAAGAVPILTAQRFAYLVAPLDRLNLAGAGVITFVAAVPPGGLPAAEATWRSRGVPGLRLTPALGGSTEHRFTIFTRSLDGRPAPLRAPTSAPSRLPRPRSPPPGAPASPHCRRPTGYGGTRTCPNPGGSSRSCCVRR
jgi:hypothetical protein